MKRISLILLLIVSLASFGQQTPVTITSRATFTGDVSGAWFIADVLSNQTRKVSGTTILQTAVKYSDTSAMLSGLWNSIALKVNYTDTAAMLLPYARAFNYYTKAQSDARYLQSFSESDPVWSAASANYYTKVQADGRYLQSFTEADPVWTAASINYYTKTQADARYLQSFTESDPVWTAASVNYYTKTLADARYLQANQSITWTASGDGSGSASGATAISPSLTITGLRGKALPALAAGLLRYTGTAWAIDNSAFLTAESDPVFTASAAAGIVATDITHWNQAYNKYLTSGTFSAGTITFTARDGTQAFQVTGLPASSGFSNPMTTLGDIIYGGASGAATRLAGNATTTKQILISTGAAGAATAPAWGTLAAGDIPDISATYVKVQQVSGQTGGLWMAGNVRTDGNFLTSGGQSSFGNGSLYTYIVNNSSNVSSGFKFWVNGGGVLGLEIDKDLSFTVPGVALTSDGNKIIYADATGKLFRSTLDPATIGLPSQATHGGQFLTTDGSTLSWGTPAGAGTVTSVSVVSASGFAGTVATATSTPAITITTTITGILKGNGTAISAAVAGTDYASPTTTVTALTAAGTNQSTALALSGNNSVQEITTAASGTGVKLPTATAGSKVVVINRGASTIIVYPNTSGIINNQAANAGYTVPANSQACFLGKDGTSWYTNAFTGGDVVSSDASASLNIQPNVVADADLRQSAGLSAIGRSANSTGNVADITASVDNQVLSRKSSTLGFNAIGGQSSITAASAAINTTETILTSYVIPAGTMIAGTTYRVTVYGTCTSTAANASNFRLRLGTAGSTADAAVAVITPTAATSGTTVPFKCTLFVTIRTTGSGTGTTAGGGDLNNNGVTGVSSAADVIGAITTTSALNTAVQNTLSLTYSSAATTTTSTFQLATIEIVKM